MLNSCLYKVNVTHQRQAPRRHRFHNEFFMFMLDLDEFAQLNSALKLTKANKRALYSFDDADHFALTPVATREKLSAFLLSRGVLQEPGKVMLLTNLRFLGYVFNPLSIYFVYDKSGLPLCAVAEVGNTFRERKPFLLPLSSGAEGDTVKFALITKKHFYVSPFSGVDDTFEFICSNPDNSLEVQISTKSGKQTTLVSVLRGERMELSDRNVFLCSLRYPFVTLGVIGLIHFHALILWLKGAPFHRKEDNPHLQRDLLNPRDSFNQEKQSIANIPNG